MVHMAALMDCFIHDAFSTRRKPTDGFKKFTAVLGLPKMGFNIVQTAVAFPSCSPKQRITYPSANIPLALALA